MFAKNIIFAVCVVGTCLALPRTRRDSSPEEYELPGNATAILVNPLQTGFTCGQRIYGYYADVDNGCQVFHVCHPFVDVDLLIKMRMFSFICGQGLVFDQEKLVCDFPENSVPCEAAAQFYDINNYFGRVDLNFREGETPLAPTSTDFQVQTFSELSQSFQ
ncbi:U-scoloptoxin(01)-Cw1a-like [Homarus americanus]|uniref:U-scoloptoxin(01)-Cw1a-like 14 n=1 Tax=Homarus americanus TaxID=6706 RepID=A0A8J5JH74_HOMAM|nr:U-scoloptoxin(01)-Cw1a-like [Homarus americanus]KAG7156251.1 U-scoloptoxin(01)-Cw1a-like 14 [Homarus americanus]